MDHPFTVKSVSPQGHERIWPATVVYFQPAPDYTGDPQGANRHSVHFEFNGTQCSIDSGTIYVMNASGSTVATYHLGNDEEKTILNPHPRPDFRPPAEALRRA